MTSSQQRLEDLIRRHSPRVLGYLLRRCSAADAAEVWQQVTIVAWRRLDQIPADHDQALAWFIATARRCQANLRRSEHRRTEATERLIEGLRMIEGNRQPDDSPVRRALEQLRPGEGEILRLMYWEKLTTEQIATVMRLKPATCRKRLQRARDRLRDRLRGQSPLAATPPEREARTVQSSICSGGPYSET